MRNTLLLLSLLFLGGCPSPDAPEETSDPEPAPADTWFPLQVGDQNIEVQLALFPEEQRKGLMLREDMPENRGMIFLFSQPRRATFWMKNTPLPLDIAYITQDGVIREIYPMEPFDETTIVSHRDDIHFALEMNQGWFEDRHVRPPATVDLENLREAVQARGAKPADFGL